MKKTSIILFILLLALSLTVQSQVSQKIAEKVKRGVAPIVAYDQNGKTVAQGAGFFIEANTPLKKMELFFVTSRLNLEGAFRADVFDNKGNAYPIMYILVEDPKSDLIVTKAVFPKNLFSPLAVNSRDLKKGEHVAVMGVSPKGSRELKDGIVDAVRDIARVGRFYQITAPDLSNAIGAPMVNSTGEVVGMTVMHLNIGQELNFAIPASRLLNLSPSGVIQIAEWLSSVKDGVSMQFTKGCAAMAINEYQMALPFFSKVIAKKPQQSAAWFFLGTIAMQLNQPGDAVKAFKQVTDIDPNDAEAFNYLGVAYKKMGRNDKALDAYNEAIRLNPDYAQAHFNLGNLHREKGRFSDAVQSYKRAVTLLPDFTHAHYNMGVCYARLGRFQEAVNAFNETIRLDPGDADAHYSVGLAYFLSKNKEAALNEVNILKKLDPKSAQRLLNLIQK